MSKLTELNQELHALREAQFGAIKEMKDTFEGGSEISVEKNKLSKIEISRLKNLMKK